MDRQTLCQSPGHRYLGPRTHTDIMRDILTVKIDLEDIETSVHQLPGHTYHELVKYSLLINKNVLQVHISCLCRVGRFVLKLNKKLSCRTEAAWCFMSLNVLLSHSMSFKMTPLNRACVSHSSCFAMIHPEDQPTTDQPTASAALHCNISLCIATCSKRKQTRLFNGVVWYSKV